MRVEHEYQRRGAWAYLAAFNVHRAQVIGRCETQTGIAPFRRLVEQVMTTAPYRQARRVFWIVDNGSSHRGARSIQRAKTWDPRLQLVHTPCQTVRWTFTRDDLDTLLKRLDSPSLVRAA